MIDSEIARANMIEQQIRPWNVLEMQTLNALGAVRREDFVPESHRQLAFMDVQIPIGNGEVMLEPKVSARMMEALHLSSNDSVLEIGTGTGYLTALLCIVAAHVTSLEIDPELLAVAERNLGMAGINNNTMRCEDALMETGKPAAFNAIVVTGSINEIPEVLLNQLRPGGRLVGIEGKEPAMQAVRYERGDNGNFTRTTLFETWAPRLKNAEDAAEFVF